MNADRTTYSASRAPALHYGCTWRLYMAENRRMKIGVILVLVYSGLSRREPDLSSGLSDTWISLV